MKEQQRVDYILNLLDKGLVSDEIDEVLDQQEHLALERRENKKKKNKYKKGRHSQNKIEKGLVTHPLISGVEQSLRFSIEDKAGVDLICRLNHPVLERVGVQAKSSPQGVHDFLSKPPKINLGMPIILLESGIPLEDLHDEFTVAVERIVAYDDGNKAA